MKVKRLEEILRRIKRARIGVLGDFCVDAYWTLDPNWKELSVETGKPVNHVAAHRYSLGAAANIAANLAALGAGTIRAFGVIGDDVFGQEMLRQLQARAIECAGLVVQEEGWNTTVFAKPHIGDEEQERFDFGTANRIAPETEDALISSISAAVESLDALIVNQQLPRGYDSDAVVERLNRLAGETAHCLFLVDSRDKSHRFGKVVFKINAIEAAARCGEGRDLNRAIPVGDLKRYAKSIHESSGKPLFVTRGERGMLVYDGARFHEIPGIQILRPIDPVGAGDAALASIAASLAAGASCEEAGRVGNFAACVTVQKLKQTGTASAEEVLAVGADPDYVFRPELSEDIRGAQYLPGAEIEIISPDIERGRIAHAVFDHDGTISTLRQGWEQIMAPVMIRAILGDAYERAPEEEYHRVAGRVRDYVDKSTGLLTIVQMQALVEMVREFGFVPEDKMLDAAGYKRIYNEALMRLIEKRIERVRNGELDPADWMVKGAVDFLRALRDRGVRLYLASGTDEADVISEARDLGYAELFEGRIFGSHGDAERDSKKVVLDRIIRERGLSGPELACFGDGPVEIREAKKRGGVAVGIASDEVRRFGLNVDKRARLVRAGADVIVPDFSQGERLLAWLYPTGS